ncbi:MAG: diaminopimelate epimerase [Deltaproteobacteria bacterium]|nr:diaminopimelate epimerase [Deltaproteobacteria bacterium]
MKLHFEKWHGLGNDFIMLNAVGQKLNEIEQKAKSLCERRLGIGCDQLIIVRPSEVADLRMQIYNADGSEVEMCGNGIRCLALFAKKHGLVKNDSMTVETLGGIKKPKIVGNLVEVDMGEPILKASEIPVNLEGMVIGKNVELGGETHPITCVSMGNPHCVLFVQNVEEVPLKKMGSKIETDALFPKKTNVEFVQVIDKNTIKLRVWERGAGATMACGTGACGAVVASILNGFTNRKVQAQLPGGNLDIVWSEKDNRVYMTGPGTEVFNGEIEI